MMMTVDAAGETEKKSEKHCWLAGHPQGSAAAQETPGNGQRKKMKLKSKLNEQKYVTKTATLQKKILSKPLSLE